MFGKLYLIPVDLGHPSFEALFPTLNREITSTLTHFVVENQKSARRSLKLIFPEIKQGELSLLTLDKNTSELDLNPALDWLKSGKNVGVVSEAGVPSIADPGSLMVKLAHAQNIEVIPLIGPCSIFLALSASGLSGQSFVFHGYIPIDKAEKTRFIKEMEKATGRNQAQIFMETPYRNNQMLEDLLSVCKEDTLLCIACDLTLPNQYIKTQTIGKWKKLKTEDLHKRPCIFILGN
ncbi:MAG: SAM-dependent methyltransferase [Flavobacteriaceae bacterium]|nr:MAG: SAM-dependent methyltransferase [Flavobacteriaceae bacterium]